ncbi:MAG: hypothetical protein HN729_06455 [Candidatus Marinimicrobia bacterium]|nr:hypothetical protein [Candidatus Neomarinimicrobiota bacterium]MBT3683711.1 hypothetical protein [Candidatus Neomarinimicrobiota bacterium]MBT3760710.1 hypothetical protein [Candidatus Neomarinimicrobiota bacterium]MBT3896732.1 hypothetical protein [Candidatus Neomarinimicrobiota bacterium]MBT4173790.1 hypothetical protein [Candidatus Neomarinimicrobiota bacterium]
MATKKQTPHQTWNFQDLMLHRVHEILLVSSPYDAFILEEDGRLTERVLHEYIGMHMSYAPRIWGATTASRAMTMLGKRKFDIIIVMMRIADIDPVTFARQVKDKFPTKPVILLIFDESEISDIPDSVFSTVIDKVFLWSGNANVFPAIIKYIEDIKNVKRDIKLGDVRAIIVVEDTPRYYSMILPMMYKIILYHTRKLINSSLDDSQRMLHMRARPKILLASSFEEAIRFYKTNRKNILGIISDIRFPKEGKLNDRAGVDFAKWVRGMDSDMPIMLQSTDKKHETEARNLDAQFLNKTSATLMKDLKNFIVRNFGFGDFVFRLPDGNLVGISKDMYELEKSLEIVPEESLKYHAKKNHFSNWLAARGEFEIATRMRPIRVSDFSSIEELRKYLITSISEYRDVHNQGRVVDFSSDSFDQKSNFIRIARGSLGGKARGLAFANSILAKSNLSKKYKNVKIRIPHVTVIGTDEFDNFMEENSLWELALKVNNNQEVLTAFLESYLSPKLEEALATLIEGTDYPIAIRSSSLLEDSQYQPLAGMYETYMLPNLKNNDNKLKIISEVVKRIYASTFYLNAKTIIDNSSHRHEEEKMAIIIQELVGSQVKNRFYPTFSGIAQSYNFYPVSYQKREEGIAFVALGLGKTVVEGGKALRFSPYYPSILPQFYSIKSTIQNSQNSFFALDTERKIETIGGENDNLKQYDLKTAEEDGNLKHIASVVCAQDNVIRDSLSYEGVRIITFASILKWKTFPLAEILKDLLQMGEEGLGCPVEIEFSANIGKNSDFDLDFCLLQIKPMVITSGLSLGKIGKYSNEEILFKSESALGDGIIDDIHHIIVVKTDNFDASATLDIAAEIEQMNSKIKSHGKYVLVGPGRWGTADRWLGIPVSWHQISGAKIIVEMELDDFKVDPSFGSHFFQNVTSMRIGYFTIKSGASSLDFINWECLNRQNILMETKYLACYEFNNQLRIKIDGQTGSGIILKPEKTKVEMMDEEESSGI